MLATDRLQSLDIFRGFTIALMILVNDPGSWAQIYPPLRHAEWHGCTPTDLVFPFFLYIVGISMAFSLGKRGMTLSGPVLAKIARRTALIFLIGLALNWFPFHTKSFAELRIMGVLQRIALAYGCAALLVLAIPRKTLPWFTGGLLLLYWGLSYALGTPGTPYSLTGNYGRFLDLSILGEAHLYGGFGLPFDPEGFFGTLSAIGTTLLGFLTGSLIKQTPNRDHLVKKLLIYGLLGIAAGYVWGWFFPINKPIWTSSYALYTAGIAACFLGIAMQFYDIKKRTFGRFFFIVFGTNALFAFVLHGLLAKISRYLITWETSGGETTHLFAWIYQNVFATPFGNTPFASLLYAIAYVLMCWLITYGMYRKGWFLKL
ncbi:MAG: DUF5009 domain-containing protein [Saprospiraceae bacterium]